MPSRRFYGRCTRQELISFAQARRIQVSHLWDATKPPRKVDYQDALRRADRHPASFRFLDLTAETRNMIYKELLIIHHDRSSCTPQILAANKQIRREATSLLYVENLIYIRFDGEDVHVGRRHCGTTQLGLVRCTWPDFLHRAQHIEIMVYGMEYHHVRHLPFGSLNYQHQPGTQRRVDELLLNQVLYSLCIFLQVKHHLRTLHINVPQTTHRYDMREPRRVFYPLRLLGGIPKCRITGLGDAAAAITPAFTLPHPSPYPDITDRATIHQLDICCNLYFEVAREVPRRGNITANRQTKVMDIQLPQLGRYLQLPAPDFVLARFHLGRIPFHQRFIDFGWERNMRKIRAQTKADLSGLDLDHIEHEVLSCRISARGRCALDDLRSVRDLL